MKNFWWMFSFVVFIIGTLGINVSLQTIDTATGHFPFVALAGFFLSMFTIGSAAVMVRGLLPRTT